MGKYTKEVGECKCVCKIEEEKMGHPAMAMCELKVRFARCE